MKRLLIALVLATACQKATMIQPSTAAPASSLTIAPDVAQRMAQLPPTVIDYGHSLLDDNERPRTIPLCVDTRWLSYRHRQSNRHSRYDCVEHWQSLSVGNGKQHVRQHHEERHANRTAEHLSHRASGSDRLPGRHGELLDNGERH